MADIFDELEEDLKEQKIHDFWKAWGNWIIGGALLIVLGAATVPLWRYYHHSVKQDESVRYETALGYARKGKVDEAQAIFTSLMASGKTGYAKLAALQSAALTLKGAETKGTGAISASLKTYQDLGLKDGSDLSFAGLVKILSGYAGISTPEAQGLEVQFLPLSTEGNPWQGMSLELQGLYALQKGDRSKAADYFNGILNAKHVSQQSLFRALLMLAALEISPKIQVETPTKESVE